MAEQKAARNPADGLKNSAFLATLLAVLGHAYLGFEQSLAQWAVAVATAYGLTIVFELIDSHCSGTVPRFRGRGLKGALLSFLSPHMTATTMAFLLYTSDRLDAMAFAVAAAIASKYVFRTWNGKRYQHFMNPSNFGIALTFIVLPWVNTIPYQFSENVFGIWDWVVVAVLFGLGFRLNAMFTQRLLLIGAWLGGYALQAIIRTLLTNAVLPHELMMMTGPAFILFSFYMITDPMTSPSSKRSQIAFGLGIAAVYGLLMWLHIVFAIFFSVTIVAGIRGAYMVIENHVLGRALAVSRVVPLAAHPSVVPAPVFGGQLAGRVEVGK